MPLFLITGLPGTGKSAVYAELKARGHQAYDGDYDHLAQWYDDITGRPIPEGGDRERTPEFLQTHSRDIARRTVIDLVSKAGDESVFLCADPENEDELVDLFAKVFALILSEDTRQGRLATRTNNQWGKLAYEIAYDLAMKPTAYARYKKPGYQSINAGQPVDAIVDYLLAQTKA